MNNAGWIMFGKRMRWKETVKLTLSYYALGALASAVVFFVDPSHGVDEIGKRKQQGFALLIINFHSRYQLRVDCCANIIRNHNRAFYFSVGSFFTSQFSSLQTFVRLDFVIPLHEAIPVHDNDDMNMCNYLRIVPETSRRHSCRGSGTADP